MTERRQPGGRLCRRRVVQRGWFDVSVVTIVSPEGQVFERSVVEHPSGASVLPYDPARRVAMLITQLRPPLLMKGSAPILEAIAGAIEAETAEICIRREAMEEAGLRLGVLDPVATVWANPSTSTEQVSLFIAEYAMADIVAEGGGLAEEQEHIAAAEVPLHALAASVDAGDIADWKTLCLVNTLRIRRPALFGR